MNRRLVLFLLAIYAAFTLYNTFIPFRLKADGPPDMAAAVRQVFLTRHPHVALTDVVGNIILFVPLGLLGGLVARRAPAPVAVPAVALLAFVFSTCIETLQTGLYARIASRNDVLNNTAGAFLGAAAVFLVPRPLARRLADRAGRLVRADPWAAGLLVLFIVAVLRAWFPFNVVISVSHLKEGMKAAVVVPFAATPLKELLAGSHGAGSAQAFAPFAFAADLWFWAFWGYVGAAVARIHAPPAGLSLALLLLPPCVLEAGQVFIGSRTLDVNDFISGAGGAVLGCVYFALRNRRGRQQAAPKYEKGLAVPFLAYVLFAGLAPFDFDPAAAASAGAGHLVPFYAYFARTSIWNLYDVFGALLSGAPVALVAVRRGAASPWTAAAAALLLGAVVETGQLFLPARTADVTDPLLMAAGAWVAARVVMAARAADALGRGEDKRMRS